MDSTQISTSSSIDADDELFLEGLSDMQRSIVTADLNNIRVQAGPGSGKTRWLLRRNSMEFSISKYVLDDVVLSLFLPSITKLENAIAIKTVNRNRLSHASVFFKSFNALFDIRSSLKFTSFDYALRIFISMSAFLIYFIEPQSAHQPYSVSHTEGENSTR